MRAPYKTSFYKINIPHVMTRQVWGKTVTRVERRAGHHRSVGLRFTGSAIFILDQLESVISQTAACL